MEEKQIIDKLQIIFDDLFYESKPVVSLELSAANVDEWDSLMNIQLMVSIEQAFKISIPPSEIENMQTVSDLVAVIKAKLL